ncbi:MAG: GGDEF domain-containing protein [Clostridiales bacterium]|nr:GGDEF domain-containing protein [Clostridiales bacterium]
MDYGNFIKNVGGIACILSIDDRKAKDSIKIIAANDAYIMSVVESHDEFVANVSYTNYIKRDPNFESLCYKCVTENHPVHAYVDATFFNAWLDNYFIPLAPDENGTRYLIFSYLMSPKADAEKLADISGETALLVLKTCIKLRENKDFRKAMDSIIADIRVLCDANSCCILLTDFNNRTCAGLCEDRLDHMVSIFDVANEDFFKVVETWPKVIDGSNCFIIEDENDWEYVETKSPIWAKSLRDNYVDTLVIYPLNSGDDTIGYIWACNFDTDRTLKIKETLEVTTFILSSEIANHQMVKQMQILSTTDLLTGVKNRNSMNNRILYNYDGSEPIAAPFGLFFVDVNGLKTINDTKGHLAGDNLLKDVAGTLSEIFKDYEVYRVGGDEFLVITPDISENDFKTLETDLMSKSERCNRAHYAVGSCHYSEIPDIRRAMQVADGRMYENKETYYKRHPEYAWDRRKAKPQ